MNLIKDRDLRTIYRKMKKKEFDERINLSASETSFGIFPLLDEGMIVDANGNPDFFIEKGTLGAFLSSLSDDYEGAVKFAHWPMATFPIMLGSWKKSDLYLVEGDDGRESLYVDLKLNTDLNIVKDLMAMPYTFGISAELEVHYDYEATELLSRSLGREIPVVDGINITNYGIVGEAGNVNSSDIQLKGGTALSVDLKALSAALDEQGENKNLAEISDLIDQIIHKVDGDAEKPVEEAPEEAVELAENTETVEEPVEVKEEAVETAEKVDEAAEEPAETNDEVALEVAEEAKESEEQPNEGNTIDLSLIIEAVDALKAENAALREQVEKLTTNLAAEDAEKREFVNKFKELTVKLSGNKTHEVKHNIGMTNGIGEL